MPTTTETITTQAVPATPIPGQRANASVAQRLAKRQQHKVRNMKANHAWFRKVHVNGLTHRAASPKPKP